MKFVVYMTRTGLLVPRGQPIDQRSALLWMWPWTYVLFHTRHQLGTKQWPVKVGVCGGGTYRRGQTFKFGLFWYNMFLHNIGIYKPFCLRICSLLVLLPFPTVNECPKAPFPMRSASNRVDLVTGWVHFTAQCLKGKWIYTGPLK